MGFMDEAAGSGGPPIMKFTKEAKYANSGSDESFNDQEFVADPHSARGGGIAIYVVIDGKFMAKRANCRWVSILPGFVLQPPPTLVLR